MGKEVVLGIDFGTTKTMAAWVNPKTGHHEIINLGEDHSYIPTTAFLTEDGSLLFGEAADELAPDAPDRYARGFKMKLGSTEAALFCFSGGVPCSYTARELTAEFLKCVKQLCEKRACLADVKSAVITRPVNFSPAQVEDLRLAAKAAGFSKVTLITEPEAAGYAFCKLSPEQAFKHAALVVDWGCGTLDMALVERSGDKVKTNKDNTAGENMMGGEMFDSYLWQYAVSALAQQGQETADSLTATVSESTNDTTEAPQNAFMRCRKAAEQGDAEAQFNLGKCYANGEGVGKDLQEAAKWYRKAAEQGHAGAQNNLGYCYNCGEGVEQDKQEAVRWYLRAAEQGRAVAQFNLGNCYYDGEGVEQDKQEAVKWYRRAAEQGHANAQFNLGVCYDKGEGVEQDKQEAAKWYLEAAKQGHANAQFNLVRSCSTGADAEQDKQEAAKWYRLTVEPGNVSLNNLGLFYNNGEGGK